MDLHGLSSIVGVPIVSLTAIAVGLSGMGVDILKLLHLDGLRQIVEPFVGVIGLVCLVDWVLCNFHLAG